MTASNDFVPDTEVPDDDTVLALDTREFMPRDEVLEFRIQYYQLRRLDRDYATLTGQSSDAYSSVTVYLTNDGVSVCDWCSEMYPDFLSVSVGNDDVCHDCDENYVVTCEGCGDRLHSDDSHAYDYSSYCEPCYDEAEMERRRSVLIQDYHHTVYNLTFREWTVTGVQKLRRHVSNFPFIGMELETNIEDECQLHDAAEYFLGGIEDDYLVLKEDGSISGFEIVTHPADYRVHLEMFPWEKLRRLSDYGMSAWRNSGTGIHIHISKDAFARGSHLYKFMTFHDRNASAIKKFAGRESNYAKFGKTYDDNRVAQAKKLETNYDRYVAVNLQPANTVELRYFRSSLLPSTGKGILEYSHALWDYTRIISAKDVSDKRALDWSAFADWAKAQDRYEHLVPLMVKRGVAN